MNDLIIIKAEEQDLESILRLQKLSYISEAKIYNDYSIEPLKQTIDGVIKEAGEKVFLKAVFDGKIVGSVRAHEENGTCYINKLIVHPNHQDKGIGKKLIKEIEKCFKVKRYELFTGHLSEKNLHIYKKLGYKKYDVKKVTDDLFFVYLQKVK